MQLTPQRRSQLLQQLMKQMEQDAQFRGNKSIGEVGLRLGTAFLNKQRMDKLKEEEAGAAKTQGANEYAVIEAMTKGKGLDRTAYKPEAAVQPGNATFNDQAALAHLMTQNPNSPLGKGIAGIMAENALTPPKPKEYSVSREEVTAKVDIVDPKTNEVVIPKGEQFIAHQRASKDGQIDFGLQRQDGSFIKIGGDQVSGGVQETEDIANRLTPSKANQVAIDQAELSEDMRVTAELLKMDPNEFLTYGGQIKRGVGNVANKLGLTGKNYEEWLKQSQRFYGLTERVFQGIRREVTGAQAAFIELEVLQQAFISNKMAPAQWSSALNLIGEMQNSVQAINKSLIEEGYDPSNKTLWKEEVGRRVDAQYGGRLKMLNGVIDAQNEIQSEIDNLPD